MAPRSIYLLDQKACDLIYRREARDRIHTLTESDGLVYGREEILASPGSFSEVEIVFSGWGCPKMDEELLDALPNLKALFYGAGSVRYFVTESFWKRSILLTSSFRANAIPVADYTVASVVFALKRAWLDNRAIRSNRETVNRDLSPGVYHGSTVGIVSLGAIGQLVCKRLFSMNLDVLGYDPYAPSAIFDEFGVQRVNSLREIFRSSKVVSLHAPLLPSTVGMITGELVRQMPEGGVLINTARGGLLAESEVYDVVKDRPDLFAVLDVLTEEENLNASPFARLPNVFLTSHIAGSIGNECYRMGDFAVDEAERYLSSRPPLDAVVEEKIELMA
ncbi:hydroxyacid dehydrogenase [Puniceicoccus vermicola]|uniref:Hydroxyacid dehydrogenase n=1 Tax=Puniceicoccus vermicola TaxID=388746 RepID=A0A7X1B2H4_9BACT|nr:hydroxyacid dehydrogenase [Puniceicoccus vermicola]MBC2604426.1 hydroxyacid dehydrogenase [Puniceicoccus vermicola]